MHITVNSLYHYIILSAATPQQSWTDKLEQLGYTGKSHVEEEKLTRLIMKKTLVLLDLNLCISISLSGWCEDELYFC